MLSGIRVRLMALVVATVVPFALLIGCGLWLQWRADQAQATRGALVDARLVAAQIDDHLGNFESLMAGLSRAVSTDSADVRTNDAMLRQVRTELPAYVNSVMVLAPDGWLIGTSRDRGSVRIRAGDRAYFQRVLAGERLVVSDPFVGHIVRQWLIAIARPVEDRSGRVRAVLLVSIALDRFQEALRVREPPPGGVIQIVNENGTVITHSQDSARWVGHNVRDDETFARHLAAGEASEAVRWPDNVERITASATAHWAPWRVSVGVPANIAFANVVSRLVWGAAAGVATILAALGLAWMLSGRIITPLRQLRTDASALAAGDLSHRSAVATHDEVGALAKSFNAMAASLEERHRELDTAREAAANEAVTRARLEALQRQANETLAAVIDASPNAIVCSDSERRIVLWNRGAEQIFGYGAEDMLGQYTRLVPSEGKAESQALFERAFSGEAVRDVHLKRMRKDGSLVDVKLAAAPMHDPDGTVCGVAWAYEDITLRKRAEEQLERLAHYDQLTGLPNRLTLNRQLGRLLAAGNDTPAAIALFDLDGFKDVNDTLGHSVGDHLLIEVGQRLTDVIAGRGQVCRLGGDEFVVIVPECGDPRAMAEIVDAMLCRLAEPFDINDHVVHLAGSAGIAISPTHGTNVDELIANADLALYDAKSSGGRVHRFFMPVLRAQAQARRGLRIELRRAFEENEFELFFQPQVRLDDEAVVGAEALLRWRHPVRGLLSPAAFIEPLAQSQISSEVGRWIIRDACEHAARWRAMGLPLARMGVNLFPQQLGDDALIAAVEDALRETGLPAEALELEITENVALNHEDAIAPIRHLHDRGVRLALDDFGTGYASLNCLTRFPLTRIKIDRHFVADITDDAEDAAIVRSLIAMAGNLGLEVIAEGVETEAQAEFLRREKCAEAQGFLYARPLPAAEFEAFLRNRRLAATTDLAELSRAYGRVRQRTLMSRR